MFWIDIIFIVLIILFALWGLKKGFLSSLISLVGITVSIVLAVWLAPYFTNFIDGIFGNSISNMFINMMKDFVAGFGNLDYVTSIDIQASEIINGFQANGIVKTLLDVMLGGEIIAQGTNVLAWFSTKLGGLVTTLCGALVLFLLIRILLALLSKLFDKITENRAINGLDRVLGLLLGAVKGLIFVAVVVAVINILCVIPSVNDFVTKWLDKTSILNDYVHWIFELFDSFTEKYNISLSI